MRNRKLADRPDDPKRSDAAFGRAAYFASLAPAADWTQDMLQAYQAAEREDFEAFSTEVAQ